MSEKKKAGRPVGTPNTKNTTVAVVPAACPRCSSTEREAVRIVRKRELPGTAPNGQPRTHVVWRRVRCRNCRQYFVELEHQNHVDSEERIENLDSCCVVAIDGVGADAVECGHGKQRVEDSRD